MPKLSPRVGRAVHIRTAQCRSLRGVVDLAQEPQMLREFACRATQLLLFAAADDQDLDVAEPLDQVRQGAQQHGHALAGLVVPPQEQD